VRHVTDHSRSVARSQDACGNAHAYEAKLGGKKGGSKGN